MTSHMAHCMYRVGQKWTTSFTMLTTLNMREKKQWLFRWYFDIFMNKSMQILFLLLDCLKYSMVHLTELTICHSLSSTAVRKMTTFKKPRLLFENKSIPRPVFGRKYLQHFFTILLFFFSWVFQFILPSLRVSDRHQVWRNKQNI